MENKQEYEIAGGIVETPERGNVVIPPEKCGRKDIEPGEIVIKTVETPEKVATKVQSAKRQGITEIPSQVEKDDQSR